uniref:RRM domain-containing protein n=1 Tax=Caenorhabditis tropicalis TaxID=1561998 RepID=A0A1I7TQ63_9PELO
MTEEAENTPTIEPEVKEEPQVADEKKPEEKDLVPELYRQHGGDPRECDLTNSVLLSGIPTDFLTDSYEQFDETIKTMLNISHNLNKDVIKKIFRIPVLDEKATNTTAALRALIWFTDKIQQCRCLARAKNFADHQQKVELIESLPQDFLFISEEDRTVLENGVHLKEEEEEEDIVGDEVEDGDEVDELMEEDEEGHDEHEEDDDDVKKEPKEEGDGKKEKEGSKKSEKKEEPKKKVYEDEDEKAPFEMEWEGAPEFQWRLCEGARDEKKLIIDNLLWADLNSVFIYRTIQRATSCEINFPARFAGEGDRGAFGKLTLLFPAFVPIMDEALKHLIYFRSGDNRRIKVFLPQTTISLKRKEEFEGKLGRLIKPTPRMHELVIKILPEDYTPTLDDACEWFPEQSVIGCELVNDEMGKPCAIVKFETAQEAVAAHASKSFVTINHQKEAKESEEKPAEKSEKEDGDSEEKGTQCNVFMRGVEAHFGSLLTFYDQRKKAQEHSRLNRAKQIASNSSSSQKRPGSTIRGPAQKKRAPSPKRGLARGNNSGPPRNVGRGGGAAPRRSSPPRSNPRTSGSGPRGGGSRGGPRGSTGRGGGSNRGGGRISGGDRPMNNRAAPRSNNYRSDTFSSQRQPARADAFSGYGYAQFENRYNSGGGGGGGDHRQTVDPFGRPMYNGSAFATSSSSSFNHRDDSSSHRHSGGGGGFSSFQENRRRY